MANANYRLTREQERALIRFYLGRIDLEELAGANAPHVRVIWSESERRDVLTPTCALLAQALIDKKRSQADALDRLLANIDVTVCNVRSHRVIVRWEMWKGERGAGLSRIERLLRRWGALVQAEARGE